jgi:hypothetical protein
MAIPPAGLSPAGFFVPLTFAAPSEPPGILADAVDPETREYLSIVRGIDPIDEQVLIALTLKRGSGAAVTDEGQDFASIRKMDESTATLIDTETRRALSRLVTQADIRIRKITPLADANDDWAEVVVEYENLRAPLNRRRVRTVRIRP